MKRKNIVRIIIAGIIAFIILIIVLLLFSRTKDGRLLDLYKTSWGNEAKDEMVGFLYDRYQVEDGYKFFLVGSDMNHDVEDTYGLYYRERKTIFEEFSSIYKSYILLDLMNYDTHGYDDKRSCYFYSLDEFKDAYLKYYGVIDDFKIDTDDRYSPRFYLDNDKICITKDVEGKQYSKAIDTYFVNGIYKDNEIIIYERVAFVKIGDNFIDFYGDYSMKDKVYSLDKSKTDLSFIHNSKIVSNVLMQYRDKFPIYEYHYKKGESTYYLESISR